MKNLKRLSKSELKEINGGMKWTKPSEGCKSYNVEDRRPGASPVWYQKLSTFAYNFWNCDEHL